MHSTTHLNVPTPRGIARPIALLAALGLLACGGAPEVVGSAENGSVGTNDGRVAAQRLGKADSSASAGSWGGPDSGAWKSEARLANAAHALLDAQLAESGVVDVTVAVPVTLLGSALHPYGDGQSNAAVTFGEWAGEAPPVVAALSTDEDGSRWMAVQWHPALVFSAPHFDVHRLDSGGWSSARVELSASRVGRWQVPADADLTSRSAALVVRPAGWVDGFPLHFRHPVAAASALATHVDANFPDQKALPDPEAVASTAPGGVMQTLISMPRPGYNPEPFVAGDVHGQHPGQGITAVGRSWTWLTQPGSLQPGGAFSQIYLCLEARRRDLEAAHGVPSGAGWHHIGDPAESLVNSLEDAAIPTAWAHDAGQPALPGSGFAWGLGDVTTWRYLAPGEALITVAGTYHWYANPLEAPLCAEIWVHPSAPCGSDPAACEAIDTPTSPPSIRFEATAETVWGEGLYVVGSLDALGAWDPDRAVPLDPAAYPSWTTELELPAGVAFSWKLIKKGPQGVVWQPGPDQSGIAPYAGTTTLSTAW